MNCNEMKKKKAKLVDIMKAQQIEVFLDRT